MNVQIHTKVQRSCHVRVGWRLVIINQPDKYCRTHPNSLNIGLVITRKKIASLGAALGVLDDVHWWCETISLSNASYLPYPYFGRNFMVFPLDSLE